MKKEEYLKSMKIGLKNLEKKLKRKLPNGQRQEIQESIKHYKIDIKKCESRGVKNEKR